VSRAPPLDRRTRRVLALVSVIVLLDALFYAAIAPLLPYYADKLDLTKASAGVLVGAYPFGTGVASLPMGWLVSRIGARHVLALGLALFGASSVTFGFAQDLWLLDVARFAQGVGAAATWTAGFGLLAAAAPEDRRAETLGTAFATALGGALLGPVLGATARAVGTGATFAVVAAIAAVLLGLTQTAELSSPESSHRAPAPEGFAVAVREPLIARGAWIIAISGLVFGVLDVLLPLKMGHLGASGTLIAGTFIGATALEAGASRPLGRLADRGHAKRIALWSLSATAPLALLASQPDTVAGLVIIGVAAGPMVGTLWIPGLAWLAEGSERAGVAYAYAFGIQSFLWSAAQATGSIAGGSLAHASTDFVPYLLVALVALATALVIRRAPGDESSRPLDTSRELSDQARRLG
jgi:MFS family permease